MVVLSTYPQDPRVRRQAEYLESKGNFVDIICLRNLNKKSYEVSGNVSIYRIMNHLKKDSFAQYIVMSTLFILLSLVKVSCLTIKKKYDLIQIHNMPDHLVFTALLPKLLRKPVLFDMHDLTIELFTDIWSKSLFKPFKSVVKILERLSCTFASKIITVSDGCKERLISRGIPSSNSAVPSSKPSARAVIFFLPITRAANGPSSGTRNNDGVE